MLFFCIVNFCGWSRPRNYFNSKIFPLYVCRHNRYTHSWLFTLPRFTYLTQTCNLTTVCKFNDLKSSFSTCTLFSRKVFWLLYLFAVWLEKRHLKLPSTWLPTMPVSMDHQWLEISLIYIWYGYVVCSVNSKTIAVIMGDLYAYIIYVCMTDTFWIGT